VEHYPGFGFVEVPKSQIRIGDVVLMQCWTKVPDHCGIYSADAELLHHPARRLSRRELYGHQWRDMTRHVLRHRSRLAPGDIYYDDHKGERVTLRWTS